jgi:glycerol-3-phosphate dehydrogenase (NAD(P)+)
MTITVIGGGSWATALIKILTDNNHKIKWWLRNTEAINHIKKHHHNPEYLSGIELHPSKVKPYHNIKDALKDTEWVVLAIPAAFVVAALGELNFTYFQNKKIISGVKGIVPDKNLLVTDWLSDQFKIDKKNIAAIAGPCHAEEIALEKQSYLTIASESLDTATQFAGMMANRYVKTSPSTDINGVEYAAVIKNIVALACGITHGLGAGDNFQAVMVSNAMIEIERFVQKIAPQNRMINASAYLGDLLVTAYSQFSRNRTFGNMIGRGYSVSAAQMEMKMIAEGYFATKSIYQINKNLGVDMPILDFAYQILYNKSPLLKAFEQLKEKLI